MWHNPLLGDSDEMESRWVSEDNLYKGYAFKLVEVHESNPAYAEEVRELILFALPDPLSQADLTLIPLDLAGEVYSRPFLTEPINQSTPEALKAHKSSRVQTMPRAISAS
ncbi:hypothetical protein Bbelb_183820 [Branchiostoma belcheri]|nr:hypothetical protein Bbelb_183820 [Branchiostoma belcheri]